MPPAYVRPLTVGGLTCPAVLARRDDIAAHYDDGPEIEWLDGHGVDLVRGYGRLAGPKLVSVTRHVPLIRPCPRGRLWPRPGEQGGGASPQYVGSLREPYSPRIGK